MSQTAETLGALFAEYEKNSDLTVLPAGKVKLKVVSCTTKNSGVLPVYNVVEGPDAGKRVMAGGIYPGSTEGGRVAFFRKLQKFGLGKDFFAQNPTLQDVATALIGRVVIINLGVSQWQGEDRNEMGFDIELVDDSGATGAVSGVPTTTPPQIGGTASGTTPTPTETATAPTPTATPTGTAAPDPGF